MTTDDLRDRANELRAEALALLGGPFGTTLREALGEYEIAGSVALDLMAWRDIDLFVQLEAADAPRMLGALPSLTEALARQGQAVTRVLYRDEHLEPDPAFPGQPGLYLGLVTAGGWKIDLWGWAADRHPEQQRRHRELVARFAGIDRDLVLRLKNALWQRPDYRSMEVYEFALAHPGATLEDFEGHRNG